jgi:hypothetical protein
LITLTATVTPLLPSPPPPPAPTGTVIFVISADGPPITVPLPASGIATTTISSLAAGNHSAIAIYSGDANFTASTSTPALLQVVNPAPTAVTVTQSPNPAVCCGPVTLTITVTPQVVVPPAAAGPPTGTVTVSLPSGVQTVPVVAGVATVTTNSLTPTTGPVTVTYNGDTCFATSTGTLSPTITPATTTTALTSSPNPSTQGQTVTFTATVSPAAPSTCTPTGTVTLTISGGPSLTATLIGGVATISTAALSAGSQVVVATYGGDSCFNGSTSPPLTQLVTASAANTTLTATPATIRFRFNGTFVIPTLSATLTNTTTGLPIPGQTITFTASTLLGPVTLGSTVTNGSGVATLTNVPVPPTVITAGTYTASFAGGSGLSPSSTTAPLTFQLLPPLP